MFLESQRQSKLVYFGAFIAGALSLLPWTAVIAEMLGAFALFGVLLVTLFVAGAFGVMNNWRWSRLLVFLGPAPTAFLFVIMTVGVVGRDKSPGTGLVAMFVLPLMLSVICLLVAVRYCAEYPDSEQID
jgi:hypothetical protein